MTTDSSQFFSDHFQQTKARAWWRMVTCLCLTLLIQFHSLIIGIKSRTVCECDSVSPYLGSALQWLFKIPFATHLVEVWYKNKPEELLDEQLKYAYIRTSRELLETRREISKVIITALMMDGIREKKLDYHMGSCQGPEADTLAKTKWASVSHNRRQEPAHYWQQSVVEYQNDHIIIICWNELENFTGSASGDYCQSLQPKLFNHWKWRSR